MSADRYIDLLEPEIAGLCAGSIQEAAKLSQAVSLRRIADALERPDPPEALRKLLSSGRPPWQECVGKARTLEVFLDTVARRGGTAIVDIEPRPDGSESTHAVATWEKSDV